ncbi:MAG: FtsX-like permease family protein [Bacteroidota bacterium]
MQLIRIAWRNIWRSRVRSLVVILAVALGLWAGVFMLAFSWGINSQRMQNIIETKISHVQVHAPEFRDEKEVGKFISETQSQQLLGDLSADERVKAVASRLVLTGMAQSPRAGLGVQINAIAPEAEAALTQLPERLIAGKYLEKDGRAMRILIGAKLMEKLGLTKEEGDSTIYGIRKSVVLKFQDTQGQTQGVKFKVQGVFKSQDSRFDASNVYVRMDDLAQYAGVGEGRHQIALLFNDPQTAEDSTYLQALRAEHADLEIENWKEIAPDLKLVDESFSVTVTIFMSVILLALLFGIVNTMMMAILERTRELGMLMAVGMNRARVFGMIMLETFFLTMVGAPIGLLAAYGSVSYFGNVGIDISAFAEGTAQFGVSSVVYTSLESGYYLQITLMVAVTALIAAIFPARRALRLNPAEAVRAI